MVWWCEELSRKRSEVRRKRKQYQNERERTGDPERMKWHEYKESMREYKRMIKEIKKRDWNAFVRNGSASNPWGKVYKICMGKNKREGLASLRTAAVYTRTWNDSASMLVNEFSPADDSVLLPPDGDSSFSGSGAREFSTNEFEYVISHMRMGKSPNIDGITNGMVLQVALAIPSFIEAMYDSCLKEVSFPKQWKVAKVVVLLKGAGNDKAEPRSYRPMSLLSGLGKIIERMMVEMLLKSMNGKWNERQYGFVKNKCTEDAWAKARELVCRSERKHVIDIFVDFKSAFDYMFWRVVIGKLRQAGCKDEELAVWHDYFIERWACLSREREKVIRRVERGCPQGSIDGPTLWNLCMNELLNDLSSMRVEAVAYADDFLLLIEGGTRGLVECRAGETMKCVYGWKKRIGVDVSDSKAFYMLLKKGGGGLTCSTG